MEQKPRKRRWLPCGGKPGARLDSANVKAVYAAAMEYQSNRTSGRGFGVWGALVGFSGCSFSIWAIYVSLGWRSGPDIAMLIFSAFAGLIFATIGITFLRLDTFSLRDEPTLFNRKTHRVHTYRKHSNWKRPFSRWPVRVETHPWDRIRAEIVGGPVPGAVPVPRYQLWLVVLDDEGNEQTRFAVGSVDQTKKALRPVWEHIRRYMEDAGPALTPDDDGERALTLNTRRVYAEWLPILYTPAERKVMQQGWGSVIFMTLIFPFGLLFGTFSWISWVTSREPKWPQDILDEAGPLHQRLSGN